MPSKLSTAEILEHARSGTEAATVGRVFGPPIERDGVTVIPVAVVNGGAGAGGGSGPGSAIDDAAAASASADAAGDTPKGEGTGGGFGFTARPAGVYVIRNGEASWRPAVDVNKIVFGGQLVAIIAILATRSILRRRRRR